MDPNSKSLCRATVKENMHVFTRPAVFVVSFFPPSILLFMAKGVFMPALLHGMISKGKKKYQAGLCTSLSSPTSLLPWVPYCNEDTGKMPVSQ